MSSIFSPEKNLKRSFLTCLKQARMWLTMRANPSETAWKCWTKKKVSGDTPLESVRTPFTWFYLGSFCYCFVDLCMSGFSRYHPLSLCIFAVSSSGLPNRAACGQGSRSVSSTNRLFVLSEAWVDFFFLSVVQCEVTVKHWELSLAVGHMSNTF